MRLVRALCDELALPARLLSLVDGERRLTNLLHVGELLHAAAVEAALAPGASLAWLRTEIARGTSPGDDAARQLRLESDDEAAQVVTVHSSKGLEYGAVWCPYLWAGDGAHEADRAHPCVHVEHEGRLVRALHLRDDGEAAAARLDDDGFTEALRLAYVALTRARHQVTLWWGAVSSFERSPLGWLLHGGACGAVGDPRAARAALEAHLAGATDDGLRARLAEIAAAAPGAIAVADEPPAAPDPQAPPARWAPPHDDARPLAARPWTRAAPLDDGWRLGSFTGLTHGAAAADALTDTLADAAADPAQDPDAPEALGDARVDARADAHATDAAADAEVTADEEPVPLAAFPASAAAGIFFHAVLEHHDFPARDALDARVGDALLAHGFEARWRAPVRDALQGVLDTPLAALAPHAPLTPLLPEAAPLLLHALPAERRINELRFELPASAPGGAPITPAALARVFTDHPGGAIDADALAAYAARVGALGFRPLRGFLTGAMDLVAHHDGRWWLVDWKSNRLGPRRADYAHAPMQAEMLASHYVLQYHLYALALHRWLRWRRPDHGWDRDVGGVFYVFLRGVGRDTGVFFDRPPAARIAALDRLFREGA
jgi:exodeoxyribonuclease V beta subunit